MQRGRRKTHEGQMRKKKRERMNAEEEDKASERRANWRDKGVMQRGKTKLVKRQMRKAECKGEKEANERKRARKEEMRIKKVPCK